MLFVCFVTSYHNAHLKIVQGKNDFTINAQDGLTAKGLDCHNKT